MLRVRPVPAAPGISYRPWRPWTWAVIVVAGSMLGISWPFSNTVDRGPLAKHEYHSGGGKPTRPPASPGSELPRPRRRRWRRVLHHCSAPASSAPPWRQQPRPRLADTLTSERAAYENSVERLLEPNRRGDPVGGHQRTCRSSMASRSPGPGRLRTHEPAALVRSPATASSARATPSQERPHLRDIEAIEAEATASDRLHRLGGRHRHHPAIVRTAPTTRLETAVTNGPPLPRLLLGLRWLRRRRETLNETTASIAGRELANPSGRPIPLPAEARTGARQPLPADSRFQQGLPSTRLLAEGRVAEARRIMEERRNYSTDTASPSARSARPTSPSMAPTPTPH
jgi:hypothetical protein